MRPQLTRVFAALFVVTFLAVPRASVAQDHWKQVGHMATPRIFATKTRLADGRVVITGGTENGTSHFTSIDIYDPATGTTTAGAPMTYGRYGHSAILLNDGRLLIVGGLGEGSTGAEVPQIELYNPATNSWTTGADTPHGATIPVLQLLADGRVLVATTRDANFQYQQTDIYDPVSNSWSPAAMMNHPHSLAGSTKLPDGRIMVAGGQGDGNDTAEIYDPATDTWTEKAQLPEADFGISSLFVMPDGRVASVGSFNKIWFYDISTDTWTGAAANPTTIVYQIPMLLSDGRILLAGGIDSAVQPFVSLNSTVVYDPSTDSWSSSVPMVMAHSIGNAVGLDNGRYLVAGGYFDGNDAIETTGPNLPPIANAGPDFTSSTCDSCIGGAVVSGAASSDPDGDSLTYIWSEGAATLATTTQASTSLVLPTGVHTLTLTVRDPFGAESTDTVVVTVTNVEDGWRAMVASLQGQVASLQLQVSSLQAANALLTSQLATCQASGGSGNPTPTMDGFETYLKSLFGDPAFELPGTTGLDELQSLITAIKAMPPGQVKQLYRSLGGKK